MRQAAARAGLQAAKHSFEVLHTIREQTDFVDGLTKDSWLLCAGALTQISQLLKATIQTLPTPYLCFLLSKSIQKCIKHSISDSLR